MSPDIYQGSEIWDLRLVDPDNREPVDYNSRMEILDRLTREIAAGRPRAELARSLLDRPEDGAIKLYLIATVLDHRRDDPDLYARGDYQPLEAEGQHKGRLVAFSRVLGGNAIIVLAPRLITPLMGDEAVTPPMGQVWGDTHVVLPEHLRSRRWRDLLTGTVVSPRDAGGQLSLPIAATFSHLPLALLVAEPG